MRPRTLQEDAERCANMQLFGRKLDTRNLVLFTAPTWSRRRRGIVETFDGPGPVDCLGRPQWRTGVCVADALRCERDLDHDQR